MVRDGDADAAGKAVVIELTARVGVLPPNSQYELKKGADLLPATEEALRTGRAPLAEEGTASAARALSSSFHGRRSCRTPRRCAS